MNTQTNKENTNLSNDTLYIFTDGSCVGNGKNNSRGGIGIVYPNNEFPNVSEEFNIKPITNQRTELYAILCALQTASNTKHNKIIIYTDSLYSMKCATIWAHMWKKNGWKSSNKKPVKNQDIIRKILEVKQNIESKDKTVQFHHINSHTGEQSWSAINNAEADKLATSSFVN